MTSSEVQESGSALGVGAEARPGAQQAEVAVLGGSGFYTFLENSVEIEVQTPYGEPSDSLALGEISGRRVAFLPRHGRDHRFPAHRVPYHANIWALHSLGVRRVLAPSAAGSLRADVRSGDFMLCDQFIDRTRGRADTFYDGPEVVHISSADAYCPELRALAAAEIQSHGIRVHPGGTVVVVQGPRFSTRAESRWFAAQGWDAVNMTQYPEVVLARELGMCYLNISLITDYDVGVEGEKASRPVEASDVLRILASNVDRVREVLRGLIPQIPAEPGCDCARALERARI